MRSGPTRRVGPLRVDGGVVHQISLPWHWGGHTTSEQGVTGDSINDLIALSGDPNVTIHESKAFRCDVRAGRRSGETTARLSGAQARPEQLDEAGGHAAEKPTFAGQTDQAVHDEDGSD